MVQYKWRVLSNTTVATLMSSIDSNIVLISLPTIGRELPQTNATLLLWILLGYSLLTAVVLLNFGRLSDMFGRVRLYVLGFAVFTVGSLLCGFSQTGIELVTFRLVQAVGAGFLFSNSAAIITDAFPPNERGRALGINQVSIVVGAVSGLVLGGIITSTIGWRWIFFVNVPIGLVATIRARSDLRELAKPESKPRVDWLGNVIFAGGLTVLLLGVTLGALGQIPDLWAIAACVVGVVLLGIFVVVESRERSPMLDLRLFRDRQFTFSALSMLLNALARGAFTFILVFYLQGPPRFLSAFTAGLFLIPVSASLATLGPISGWLSDRYGPRPFVILGLLTSAAGFLWLSTIGPDESFVQLTPPLILVGAGMGLFASPNRAQMMTAAPPARRGVASGVGTTLLNTGVTISLGITLIVMASVLPRSAISAIFLGTVHPGQSFGAAAGFLNSIHLIFLVSAGLLVVALIPWLWRSSAHPSPVGGPVASAPSSSEDGD
ncbi:MAG TPA: MFS transporter [Thermoplasmata archaeon]|nr:MFS transporter [Thermoplasmata archaeon]